MTKDEALKLALEALKQIDEAMPFPVAKFAQAAIREALTEQPAPPPECQTEAEKTAFAFGWWKALESVRQPSKPWVGLTEQEHTDIAVECGCMSADWVFYGAAVERKLKEKNS